MKLCEQGVIREEALLAYLNNGLTAEEKQEMEKLLHDDPFAQDALEGLRESGKEKLASAVISINKKVRERTGVKEAKMIKLHWTNYAWAAVVFGLLIGIGFLMVTYMGKPDNAIAMNKKVTEEPVQVMEQKQDVPNLVLANADSITTVSANEIAAKDIPAVSVKPPVATVTTESKPAPTESKAKTTTPVPANQHVVTATGGAAMPITPVTAEYKKTVAPQAAPQAGVANDLQREEVAGKELRSKNVEPAKTEQKADKRNANDRVAADNAPASQTVMRGALMEKETPNKVTVITMDDAMKSFNGGDYKASSDQFSEILKQQPNNADALYFGGISEYINGNSKKSEKNFDKLLKEGTKFSEGSKWYKANILLKKGKKDEAKKILDELANSTGSYKERAVKKKAEMEF